MGIFDFFKKEKKTEVEKQKITQKSTDEIIEFFNNRTYEELIKMACENSDMSNYYYDVFKLVKPSILLLSEQNQSIDKIIGASKIGGTPDVPKDFKWPTKEDLNLSFLLQINCKDLPENSLKNFPQEGIFSFFFGFDNELESTYPNRASYGQVFYFNEIELEKIQYPIQTQKFNPCSISFINYPSLPYIYDNQSSKLWDFDFLKKEDDLEDGYANIEWSLEQLSGLDNASHSRPHHQLFGYPRSVQGENIEVKIVKTKFKIDNEFDNFTKSHLEKVFNQQLLIQIAEDTNANLKLIDEGKIYFIGEKNNDPLNQDLWTCVDFS